MGRELSKINEVLVNKSQVMVIMEVSTAKGGSMKQYKVSMINSRLNFRNFVIVEGCSCLDAGEAARKMLGPEGYDRIESIVCIGHV